MHSKCDCAFALIFLSLCSLSDFTSLWQTRFEFQSALLNSKKNVPFVARSV